MLYEDYPTGVDDQQVAKADFEELQDRIEEIDNLLAHPITHGIYPETQEGRQRYAELESEREQLDEELKERFF